MDKQQLELYTDYLISNCGYATATGLSAMVDGAVSHNRVTRFLSAREYTSKDLWREVKSRVRQMEGEQGVLIFDDTLCEKAWTDENKVVCWHYDHSYPINKPCAAGSKATNTKCFWSGRFYKQGRQHRPVESGRQ